MHSLSSLGFSSPRLKAAWLAAGAAAAAALVTLGACSDAAVSKIAAPKQLDPRAHDVLPIGALHAEILLCLDPSSAPGTYHFVITQDAFPTPEATDVVTSPMDLVPGFAGGPCVHVLQRSTTIGDNYVIDTNNGDILANFDHDNPPPGTAPYNPPGIVHIAATVPGGYTVDLNCTSDQPSLVINCSTNPTALGVNVFHGASVTYKFTGAPILEDCVLGYPFTSSNPRTRLAFNESEVLSAFGLGTGGASNELRVWYTDEHALTLGVNKVSVKDGPPNITTVTNYPSFTPQVGAIGAANPVNVGDLDITGDQRATDGFERPLFPALFITDITGLTDDVAHTDPAIRAGDWQFGGTPVPPHAVYGTWKAAAIFLDKTKNPDQRTMTPGSDPAKNHKNVGPPPATPPPAGAQDFGFSAEVVWDLNSLGLQAGHSYRLQFMVHDGDQNKTGGDVGEACANLSK